MVPARQRRHWQLVEGQWQLLEEFLVEAKIATAVAVAGDVADLLKMTSALV